MWCTQTAEETENTEVAHMGNNIGCVMYYVKMEKHTLPFCPDFFNRMNNYLLLFPCKTENERNSRMNTMTLFQWKMSNILLLLTFLDDFDIFSLIRLLGNFACSSITFFSKLKFSVCVLRIIPNINDFYIPVNWKVDFQGSVIEFKCHKFVKEHTANN